MVYLGTVVYTLYYRVRFFTVKPLERVREAFTPRSNDKWFMSVICCLPLSPFSMFFHISCKNGVILHFSKVLMTFIRLDYLFFFFSFCPQQISATFLKGEVWFHVTWILIVWQFWHCFDHHSFNYLEYCAPCSPLNYQGKCLHALRRWNPRI